MQIMLQGENVLLHGHSRVLLQHRVLSDCLSVIVRNMQSKSVNKKTYKTLLTIAGSDSIGGAGIQADIKTASALSVYAMSAITAVTAQNTTGVQTYKPVGADILRAQLQSVICDVQPDAIKIGMLPDKEAIDVVAEFLECNSLKNVVLDPVCVATSGDRLSAMDTPAYMAGRLFRLATVITPNIPELRLLSGVADNAETGVGELYKMYGCRAVLVKGGHLDSTVCSDCLYTVDDGRISLAVKVDNGRLSTPNTHGTGCTLSTAIGCYLAKGCELSEAVRKAIEWLHGAISAGADYSFGHGHGPVKHFYNNEES